MLMHWAGQVPKVVWWVGFAASQVALMGLVGYWYRQAVHWHSRWYLINERIRDDVRRGRLAAETIVAPRFHAPRSVEVQLDRYSSPTIDVTDLI